MPSICKRVGLCECGKQGKYGVFDKYFCEDCYNKRPHPNKGKGNGGLILLPKEVLEKELSKEYLYSEMIDLIKVPKGNKVFASLFLTHYPNSKGIVGRSITYLIIYKGKIIGITGFSNPPYAVKGIDEFFGINKINRVEMNAKIVNHNIYRLINNEHNLASKCLKIIRKQGVKDWKEKYGNDLIGFITFVEPPRKGTCYLADNWVSIGETKGFGTVQRSNRWEVRQWVKKDPKLIFGYKL